MHLGDLVQAGDIVFGLHAADIGSAAARLLTEILPRQGFSAADTRRLADAVVAREREMPTLCGEIAIPHARDAALTSFVAGVGLNPAGIIEGAPRPRVIIAFVSPESQRNEHLSFLASLARLSNDGAMVAAIVSAPDADHVLAILRARGA